MSRSSEYLSPTLAKCRTSDVVKTVHGRTTEANSVTLKNKLVSSTLDPLLAIDVRISFMKNGRTQKHALDKQAKRVPFDEGRDDFTDDAKTTPPQIGTKVTNTFIEY